jgi:hypothetical protein
MTLTTRVERIERNVSRRDCAENHFRMHVTWIDLDGVESADAEPPPCPACGGPLNVLRLEITTVPDRER